MNVGLEWEKAIRRMFLFSGGTIKDGLGKDSWKILKVKFLIEI